MRALYLTVILIGLFCRLAMGQVTATVDLTDNSLQERFLKIPRGGNYLATVRFLNASDERELLEAGSTIEWDFYTPDGTLVEDIPVSANWVIDEGSTSYKGSINTSGPIGGALEYRTLQARIRWTQPTGPVVAQTPLFAVQFGDFGNTPLATPTLLAQVTPAAPATDAANVAVTPTAPLTETNLQGLAGEISGELNGLQSEVDTLPTLQSELDAVVAELDGHVLTANEELGWKSDGFPSKAAAGDLAPPLESYAFDGAFAEIAHAGTIAGENGNLTAHIPTQPARGFVQDGELRMSSIGANGIAFWAAQRPVAAGLTMITRFRLVADSTCYGSFAAKFSENSNASGASRGGLLVQGDKKGQVYLKLTHQDTTMRYGLTNVADNGEYLALAIKHDSLTRQSYYVQGGKAALFGAALDSNVWLKVGESQIDNTGPLNAYPLIQRGNVGGTVAVSDFQILPDWSPSSECVMFDHSHGKVGIHVPTYGRDPVTGLLVLAWNNGAAHVGTDTVIRASVRLASGEWTSPQTIVGAPGGGDGVNIGSLSSVGGELWLTDNLMPGAADAGIIRRRVLTVDPSTGVITSGSPVVLSGLESGTKKLTFAPVQTTAGGALLIPYHYAEGSPLKSYVGRSVDAGATWTEHAMTSTLPAGMGWAVEPSLYKEDDGEFGCLIRSSDDFVYYVRSTDGGEGTAWTDPVPTGLKNPTGVLNGTRVQAIRHSSGRKFVAFNDDFESRIHLSVAEMGDNGVVLSTMPLEAIQDGPESDGLTIHQYPTLLEDGDRLVFAASKEVATGIGGSSTTAIVAWRPDLNAIGMMQARPQSAWNDPTLDWTRFMSRRIDRWDSGIHETLKGTGTPVLLDTEYPTTLGVRSSIGDGDVAALAVKSRFCSFNPGGDRDTVNYDLRHVIALQIITVGGGGNGTQRYLYGVGSGYAGGALTSKGFGVEISGGLIKAVAHNGSGSVSVNGPAVPAGNSTSQVTVVLHRTRLYLSVNGRPYGQVSGGPSGTQGGANTFFGISAEAPTPGATAFAILQSYEHRTEIAKPPLGPFFEVGN